MTVKYCETRLFKFAVQAYRMSKQVVPTYSSRFSKKTYTLHQHLAILLVKERTRCKFHEMEELLLVSDGLREALELERVPDHTTMCRALQRLRVVVYQLMLTLSGGLMPASGKVAVDSTGFDRRHASKHYVKRTKMTLQSMKTTFAVDTSTLMFLGVHTTTTRKHDSQILLPLVEKVVQDFPVNIVCADKGYDSKDIRDTLHDWNIRPLIKHREFTNLDKAHNACMNPEDYNQRLMTETNNSTIKRKYGDTLTTKTYWRQHRETLIKAITHNLDRYITKTILAYARIATKLKNRNNIYRRMHANKKIAGITL